MTKPEHTPVQDEPPPVFGSWRRLYLVLIVELLLITAASYGLAWWAAS